MLNRKDIAELLEKTNKLLKGQIVLKKASLEAAQLNSSLANRPALHYSSSDNPRTVQLMNLSSTPVVDSKALSEVKEFKDLHDLTNKLTTRQAQASGLPTPTNSKEIEQEKSFLANLVAKKGKNEVETAKIQNLVKDKLKAIREKNSFDINTVQSVYGQNLLHLAVLNNDEKMVQLLLKHGMKLESCTKEDESRLSPLLIALYYYIADKIDEDNNILFFLIGKGLDVNALSLHGQTLLHYLVYLNAKADQCRVLLSLPNEFLLDTPNKEGNTAVHFASDFRRKELLEVLLQNGASPSKVNNKGETPLMKAESTLAKDCMELLENALKTQKRNQLEKEESNSPKDSEYKIRLEMQHSDSDKPIVLEKQFSDDDAELNSMIFSPHKSTGTATEFKENANKKNKPKGNNTNKPT